MTRARPFVDYRRPMSRAGLTLLIMLVLSSCGSNATVRSSPTPSAGSRTSASPIGSASTTPLPVGREAAAMAYDQARHNVVLFGGVAGQSLLDDTWTWNGTAWSQRQGLTVSPPARQGGAMAYDQVAGQVILFGGLGTNGTLADTWAWDGNAWQQLHPAHSPSKRQDASATYELALRAIFLYGGIDQGGTTTINESWTWSNGDWSQVSVGSPAGGLRPRTAYLIGANLVDRFGDCSDKHDAGVYAFDGGSWGPRTTSGTPPPALCLPSLAGNTIQRGVLLFGGNPAPGATPVPADTYLYDGDIWQKLSPAQSPPARDDAAMVFDNDHQLMVLFGGMGLNQGQSGPLNDTWTWDGTNWTSH